MSGGFGHPMSYFFLIKFFVYLLLESVGNLLGCEFSCICFWNQLGVCWDVNFRVFHLEISWEISWNYFGCKFRVFAFEVSWDVIFMYLLLESVWESVGM